MGFWGRQTKAETPYGLSRGALLGGYEWVVLWAGCVYWGWQGIAGLLYRSGAYAWQCGAVEDYDAADLINIGGAVLTNCPARRLSINNMFTFILAANYCTSIITGYIKDRWGPRVSATLGGTMNIAGWVLLASSGENFQAYYIGAMMIGISCDCMNYGLLTICKLFPEAEMTVLGVIGSTRSLSFGVPLLLCTWANQQNLLGVAAMTPVWAYVCACLIPAWLVCFFLVPNVAWADEKAVEAEGEGETVALGPWRVDKALLRDLTSVKYWAGVAFFVLGMLRNEFYMKSVTDQLKADGQDAFGLYAAMNIMSFLPGPVCGYVADVYGLQVVQLILNIATMAMYGFAMAPGILSKRISAVLVMVCNSFVLSNLYAYVALNFPAKRFGVLAGVGCTCAGVLAFLSVPLYTHAVTNDAFNQVNWIMQFMGIVGFGLVAVMYQQTKGSKASELDTVEKPLAA